MRRYLKSCALGASCLPIFALPAVAAGPLPGGGNFISGSGHISATPTQLTVNQTSKNGIINWGSFSIGPGNGVQINNGSGATLNRVIGNSLSQIDGSLNATGSVYLLNQNGILVTPTGRVVTGGDFVASTRDTSSPGFGDGIVRLSGNSGASVSNQGSISAGGNAVLVGKSASNSGTISAQNGIAALVAGDDVTLQPGPAGLQIKVSTGSGDVSNSGAVAAAQAMLKAVGGNVYALAGNNSVISATGTANIKGHVWLTAGGGVDIEAPVNSSGAVRIHGRGAAYSAVESNGGADGVYIDDVISAGGPISITGNGGNAGGLENYGVMIDANGAVQATGKAAISITGTGGGANGNTFGNDGVNINYGLVQGNGGAVTITGTGGASTGPDNFGVTQAGAVLNSGKGNITITGTTGSNGCGYLCSPIGLGEIGIANLGVIVAESGNVLLTGNVAANATGAANFGIGVGAGVIATGGKGNITLIGNANGALGSNVGVFLTNYAGLGSPTISVLDGQILVVGAVTGQAGVAAGSNAGVDLQSGTIASTGTGGVAIVGLGGIGAPLTLPDLTAGPGSAGPLTPASLAGSDNSDSEASGLLGQLGGPHGPAVSGNNNSGVVIDGTVASSGASVTIIGSGGNPAGAGNAGIVLTGTGVVANTGNGNVNLLGEDGIDLSGPVSAANHIQIVNQNGNVILDPGASLSAYGTGNAVTIQVNEGSFINDAGAGAISTPNGKQKIHQNK